ncbi:MAG: hypothetical protein EXQ52_00140 [Bryobacterales bacterium]|nr:hypothetical protein [Bryobacterales bacterium]
MSKRESNVIRFHEDPDFFRMAVNFTATVTGFGPRLIEKDYFSTLMLDHLATIGNSLVFKGGTSLAKVHAGFYRLSEDLDFMISLPVDALRLDRSKRAKPVKDLVAGLGRMLPVFRLTDPLKGLNSSRQYNGVVAYTSLITGQEDTIRLEVALREPLLQPALAGLANTILLNPTTEKPLVAPVDTHCISKDEAFSEKFRAALTRREVAIRDFFDIDYAVRHLDLRPRDQNMIELVRQKLAVPGNDAADVSGERLGTLRRQLEPQLKPVLREKDFAEFDLQRAFKIVVEMAARVA